MLAALFVILLACANGVGALPGGGAGHAPPIPPAVTAIAVAPSGAHAFIGLQSGAVERVELEGEAGARLDRAPLARLKGSVVAVFPLDSGAALVGTDSGEVGRIDVGAEAGSGAEPVVLARHAAGLQGLALSADGKLLVGAGTDGVLIVWTLPDGAERARVKAHEGPVAAVVFAGSELYSAGWDGHLRGWRVPAKAGSMRAFTRHDLSAREGAALAASPDGAWLASAAYDGALLQWKVDRRGAKSVALPDRPNREWASAVAFSRDGRRAAAALAAESAVGVWEVARPAEPRWIELTKAPSVLAFLPDGSALLVGRWDGGLERVALPKDRLGEGSELNEGDPR